MLLDQFSRFVAAAPIPDKSAKTVSNAILTHWISQYGAPQTIRMDNGTEFTNSIITNMMGLLKVKIKVGEIYNHQSILMERFHQTLWALLRAKKCNGENVWEKSLPTLILAYNETNIVQL